jgi:hypothetical protein
MPDWFLGNPRRITTVVPARRDLPGSGFEPQKRQEVTASGGISLQLQRNSRHFMKNLAVGYVDGRLTGVVTDRDICMAAPAGPSAHTFLTAA